MARETEDNMRSKATPSSDQPRDRARHAASSRPQSRGGQAGRARQQRDEGQGVAERQQRSVSQVSPGHPSRREGQAPADRQRPVEGRPSSGAGQRVVRRAATGAAQRGEHREVSGQMQPRARQAAPGQPQPRDRRAASGQSQRSARRPEPAPGPTQARPSMPGLRRLAEVPVLPAFFLGLLAALLVLGLALPDSDFSETENRNLQTAPELTLSSFVDGSFQSEFQTYVEDQFPARDLWVTVKSTVATLAGRVENNGVYRCSDGTMILGFVEPEEDTAAEAVVEFVQAHEDLDVYTMVAPTAAGINKDKLPSQVVMPDQRSYLEGVNARFEEAGAKVVDLWNAFEAKKDAGLYYRTDHHWTTYGAQLAYSNLASALGIDTTSKRYNDLVMTDSFSGSLSAEGGYLTAGTEELHVYLRSDQEIPCVVTYVSEGSKSASPYVSSALDKRDAYQVFFGGNHPLVQIDCYAENSKGTLLIVKDSYANCLIPFLIGDYERIIVVDPRYYTGDLESLLSSNSVDDVLFLYNATTFAQDTSLKRLVDAGLAEAGGSGASSSAE